VARAQDLDNEEGLTEEEILAQRKARALKKFQFKGVDLERLLDMPPTELVQLLPARTRRRIQRMGTLEHPTMAHYNVKRKRFLAKVKKAKKDCGLLDKPKIIKTHLRDMVVVPQMVGSIVAVYNGKAYSIVEVKPEMIGRYLGEFSMTYKPTIHGRPALPIQQQARFIPVHGK
jgi:small subunit ribosomal protein S15e